MRSVRCNACGTKALTAASKCPKCSHLFEVRDGFGELLPLAYCSSCDSYYPESVGSCVWCGTKPERAPIAPYVWRGVGVAALVVLAGGAWLMRDSRSRHADNARLAAQLKPDSIAVPADTIGTPTTIAAVDTVPSVVAVTNTDSIDPRSSKPRDMARVASLDTVVPAIAPRSVATPKTLDKPAGKLSAPPSSTSRPSSRWVNSIAKHWVIVRADASRGARIVASVGPNSHVQLGESRGEWRRIKAKGVAGWVEPRSSFVAARTSPKASGLAAR